ncbi:MAG: ornithine racemase Orr [Lutispora sp.]|nr:ornithine racemase Orr [Lutispora sp.]
MNYPALKINLTKLENNTRLLVEKCAPYGISISAVTKVFCGMTEVAEAVVKGGAAILADSRVENLKKLRNFNLPKMLLRIPMLSQIDEVLEYADISLNSEYKVIEALSNAAVKKGKIHDIILMVDLGDLREGVWADDAVEYAGKILQLKGVNLKGIGTNLTCYGAIIPQEDNLSKLEEIANMITQKYGIKLSIISGGNSSSLYMVEEGRIPKAINNLRLGESIVLGNETAYGKRIEGTYNDCFTLCAEIIELKEKPSVPIGEIGVDAFGNRPTFVDRGIRKRGILAVGKQDVRIDGLTPIDSDIIILGASSDHMIIDITDSTKEYTIGDIIEFTLDYGALLSTSTSNYVKKVIE